ncbi:MAG: nucleoside monophosphate kinase [Candidatus Pacebacteria bacterium]|nr:nucleoside monophosphate kinase [Candidatus Paceibacterota bacterium]
MNLIIAGPQASGKGVQADFLKEKLGLVHFSIGQALRKLAKQKSSLGKQVDYIINTKGLLVPEKITTGVVRKALSERNLSRGIVFDGYPRTQEQVGILDQLLKEKNTSINRAFFLVVGQEEIKKRLLGRVVCVSCGANYNIYTQPPLENGKCDKCQSVLEKRSDESAEAINNRYTIYQQETVPVINLYRQKGILEEVDGNPPPEVVFETIFQRLKKAGLVGE